MSITNRVAFPAVRAQGPLLDVELAVVRRVLQEDQVGVRVRLEPREPRQQHSAAAAFALLNLVGVVELVLQRLANLRTIRAKRKIIHCEK